MSDYRSPLMSEVKILALPSLTVRSRMPLDRGAASGAASLCSWMLVSPHLKRSTIARTPITARRCARPVFSIIRIHTNSESLCQVAIPPPRIRGVRRQYGRCSGFPSVVGGREVKLEVEWKRSRTPPASRTLEVATQNHHM